MGLDPPGGCGTAETGQAGTHQPSLGWPCQGIPAPPWFSFALWLLQVPLARLEGKPGPSPTGMAPGEQKVALCGVPFAVRWSSPPSACLSSTHLAGYQSLPVKISFGTRPRESICQGKILSMGSRKTGLLIQGKITRPG